MGKEGKGKGGEEKGKGGEGQEGRRGRLILMRSWNRAADWLRPTLRIANGIRTRVVTTTVRTTQAGVHWVYVHPR